MFEVALHSEFDFLGAEYRALFESARVTAFQHPLWLDRIYKRLVPHAGADPLIVTVRAHNDGRLVSVLPLLRRKSGGLKIVEYADLGVSDYVTPIYAPEDQDTLAQDSRCSEDIRRALIPFDLIRIIKIRDDGPLFSDAFGPMSRSFMRFSAHETRLFAPFSDWRAERLDDKFTRFLDRKRRQLCKKGQLSFRCVTDASEMDTAFDKLREYRGARFQDMNRRDILQERTFYEFYLDAANSGHDCGLSRTHMLCLDGEPIATHFGLAHKGTLYFLLVGFNLAEYRNQSVGLLIVENLAADCIARGETILDLTIGDEPYKWNFGTKPTRISCAWYGEGLLGSVASATIEYGGRAKRLARRFRRASA